VALVATEKTVFQICYLKYLGEKPLTSRSIGGFKGGLGA